MNRCWSRAVLASLLLLTVLLAVAFAAARSVLPLDGATLTLDDGEAVALAGWSGGHVAAGLAIAAVATLAALVVGAFAVVFALVLAALGIGIGLVATAGSLALVVAPFLLVGWLLWRLLRPQRGATRAAPSAGPSTLTA